MTNREAWDGCAEMLWSLFPTQAWEIWKMLTWEAVNPYCLYDLLASFEPVVLDYDGYGWEVRP